jgi:cytochrome c oxidase subunit 2
VSATGATAPGASPGPPPGHEPHHGIRIAILWAILTAVGVPVIIFVVGPHLPPFTGNSVQANDQHDINVTLLTLAVPVAALIWVYFGYAVTVFRQRGPEIVDGPPIVGTPRLQIIWLVVTAIMVLGLATYGTVDLLGSSAGGVGGGEGATPLVKPSAATHPLQIQVIGQQWLWTFRYPGYGGVETPVLALPENRWIEFHVTSLDVIHSFWAIELGVKADAVPGSDNVAYVDPLSVERVQVRCAELCGLWHGHMNTRAQVMTQPGFASWIARQQVKYARVTKYLPPYSHIYYPAPLRRAG